MTGIVEAIVLAVFVVVQPIWGFISWPKFVREMKTGGARLRARGYIEVLVIQWSLTSVLLICWAVSGRPWSRLGLGVPGVWGWVALGVVAIVGVLALIQILQVRAQSEESIEKTRREFGDTIFLLPHTRTELRWFGAVALTAGFCEEVVYRGVLPVFLCAWLPAPWAVVAATLAFGIGHAYQGASTILKILIGGSILAIIVWVTDSLWPAIALHAIVDLYGGALGYVVCSHAARAER